MRNGKDISNQIPKLYVCPLFGISDSCRQTLTRPVRYTVGQYLRNWLISEKKNVGQRTFETYRQIVEKHLIPSLGNILLADLTPLDIDQYYTYALESGRLDGKGGLSASSVAHQHRLLYEALKQAFHWELICRNPAAAVRSPKIMRKEMATLNEEQLARLLKAAQGSLAYIPILLAATTGARRGEVLGLRWDDLDLESGIAVIRRSLQLTETGISYKEPKTRGSRRLITLPLFTITALKKHRQDQVHEKLISTLVCAQRDGSPMNPGGLSKMFAAIVRRTGIPHVRLHDLRHTHATQLLRQGINAKVVSERLGHASVSVTLDIYSHVLPGMQEEAAKKIDAAISREMVRLAA